MKTSQITHRSKNDLIFYWVSFIFSVFCCAYYIFSTDGNVFDQITSSDALYMASLYKDLFENHRSIIGWNLNTTSLFFPNFIIFSFFNLITGNFLLAQYLHGIAQYILLLFSIYYLAHIIKPNIRLINLAIVNLLISLIPIDGIFIGNPYLALYLILPYHIGAFIITILTFVITIKYFQKQQAKYIVWIYLITIVMTFSDRIFILFYSAALVPVLFLQLFNKYTRKTSLILLVHIIIAAIAGLLILRGILLSNVVEFSPSDMFVFERIATSFHIMSNHYWKLILANHLNGIIFKLSMLVLLILIPFSIILIKKMYKKRYVSFQILFLLYALFFAIGIWVTPGFNGTYIDETLIRYNIWSIYILMTVIPLLLDFISRGKFFKKIVFTLVLLLAISSLAYSIVNRPLTQKQLEAKINYYPKECSILDSLANVYHVKRGVGNYWIANKTSMFSKHNLLIRSVYYNFQPHFHNGNKNDYFDFINKERGQEFEFAVFYDSDSMEIRYTKQYLKSNSLKEIRIDNIVFFLTPSFYYDYGRPFIIRNDRKAIYTREFEIDTLIKNVNSIVNIEPMAISFTTLGNVSTDYALSKPYSLKCASNNDAVIIKFDSLVDGYDYRVEVFQLPVKNKIDLIATNDSTYTERNTKPIKDFSGEWGKTYIDFKAHKYMGKWMRVIIRNSSNKDIYIDNIKIFVYKNE